MNFQNILASFSDELTAATSKVMLVGSFSEELATETSDIDLYVFTSIDFQGEYFLSQECRVFNGRPVEISIINTVELAKCLKMYRLSSYSSFDPRQLERLHKVIKSKTLYQACPSESSEFDICLFNSKMVAYYDAYLTDIWLDLIGSYKEGDIHSAIGFADFMVETAIDAWLAHCGDTYPKSKWRAKRVLRLAKDKPDIVNHYMDHRFNSAYNKVLEYSRYLDTCLSLIFRLKEDILTDQSTESSPSKLGVLKPAQLLFVYSNKFGFFLHSLDKVMKIDRATAEIIYCLHRNLNIIDMVKHLSLVSQHPSNAAGIELKIKRLMELKLLIVDE